MSWFNRPNQNQSWCQRRNIRSNLFQQLARALPKNSNRNVNNATTYKYSKKYRVSRRFGFCFFTSRGNSTYREIGWRAWTDYNSHDPGITILEVLCYALTDLGMRIDKPILDLLTAEQNSFKSVSNQFYKASQILPTTPVNELDYRGLFIDIPGVRNCWMRIADITLNADTKNDTLTYNRSTIPVDTPASNVSTVQLKGLYDILVDYEDEVTEQEIQNRINPEIFKRYHANRNLCEDLIKIKPVEELGISVCGQIDLLPDVDEEWVHAQIYHQIANYFSTKLRFYGVSELIAKGYTTDRIFSGPLLENGFLDPEELASAQLRKEVRLSDLMQIIMNIEGVRHIKDIAIGFCDPENIPPNPWVICVPEDKKPVLCERSKLNYTKGVLPLNINQNKVRGYLTQLKEAEDQNSTVTADDKDLKYPSGTYIEAAAYSTVQNDFPDTYGIGTLGLGAQATGTRKAQAKTIKSLPAVF